MATTSIVVYFQESREAMVLGQPGLLFTHTVRFRDPVGRLTRKIRELKTLERKLSELEIKHIRAGRKSSALMRVRLSWLLKQKKGLTRRIHDSVSWRLRYADPKDITLEHGLNGESYVPVPYRHESVELLRKLEGSKYADYSIQ